MHSLPRDTTNLLLRALSPEDFALLDPHLQSVGIPLRKYLTVAEQPIETIYFLESGVASIVSNLPQSGPTEVGIFGCEGMSGTAVLLGADRSPHDTFIQIEGNSALAIDAGRLCKAIETSTSLHLSLLRFVQAMFVQTAHGAVSNAHHRIETRLARWLLMCHDRIDGDNIHITHEFMSMMIAAQRTGVTTTLHVLEGQNMIRLQRGLVTIIDREKLEDLAGDAYGKPEAEFSRLIVPFGRNTNVCEIDGTRSRQE